MQPSKQIIEAVSERYGNGYSVEFLCDYKDAKYYGISVVSKKGEILPVGLPNILKQDSSGISFIEGEDALKMIDDLPIS